MAQPVKIGIIGDFKPDSRSHIATQKAIGHAANALDISIEVQWLPTPSLEEDAEASLQPFDGLWCSPGSPYQSMEGALQAIRFAREAGRPFIGT
jgi:CTP synthase (UTP-ammonia lyase)